MLLVVIDRSACKEAGKLHEFRLDHVKDWIVSAVDRVGEKYSATAVMGIVEPTYDFVESEGWIIKGEFVLYLPSDFTDVLANFIPPEEFSFEVVPAGIYLSFAEWPTIQDVPAGTAIYRGKRKNIVGPLLRPWEVEYSLWLDKLDEDERLLIHESKVVPL